jgi:predicted nucleic acid-binding protein
MGSLTLPTSGVVYVDTQVLVYTIERHPRYAPLLRPLWKVAQARTIDVVSSELALMETLIAPLRTGDAALQADYERALLGTDMRLIPISQSVLRQAARLRAAHPVLRTPDALHAATGEHCECRMFLTNDQGFRQVPGLPLVILDDVLSS